MAQEQISPFRPIKVKVMLRTRDGFGPMTLSPVGEIEGEKVGDHLFKYRGEMFPLHRAHSNRDQGFYIVICQDKE